VEDPSLVCLVPHLDVLLELAVQVQMFPAFAAPDLGGLKIIPDNLLAACRSRYYQHKT